MAVAYEYCRQLLRAVGVCVAVELQHARPRKSFDRADGLHEDGAKFLASGGWDVEACSQHGSGRILDGRRRKTGLLAATFAVH